MAYSIIATNEMNMLLDNCVDYLLNKLNNQQAAEHLLAEVAEVYEQLEDNPYIYRMSQDSFMKSLNYHEAKIKGMDYVIIYKVLERNIYILGIFHTLENYAQHMEILWSSFKP